MNDIVIDSIHLQTEDIDNPFLSQLLDGHPSPKNLIDKSLVEQ